MSRKAFTLSLIIISALLQSCSLSKSIKGDGNITSQEYVIADYKHISLSGSKQIFYEQKVGTPYLRIETDKNLFELLDIQVAKETLYVKNIEGINPSSFKVYTNSPELTSIRLAGSGRIQLNNEVKSDDLSISISGSGNINAEKLVTTNLKVSISGSGNAVLNNLTTDAFTSEFSGSSKGHYTGKANTAKFSISGSGNIDAISLETSSARCHVSGSGKVSITASEDLDVSVSGSGRIEYKGDAKVSQSISGSGKIVRL